jgi:hypothetical protein
MRISRSRRCECLKHLFQKEDKLIPEGFLELIMPKRWTHSCTLDSTQLGFIGGLAQRADPLHPDKW